MYQHLCTNTSVPALVCQHLCSIASAPAPRYQHKCASACVPAPVYQRLHFSPSAPAPVYKRLCSTARRQFLYGLAHAITPPITKPACQWHQTNTPLTQT
ncbi:MAG: hypothetical protein EAY75_03180 [Bacteroidetes bacterium]|nr:MAG: hypothetical protein EAY75_03180 [Bacteroidota bacterium]